MSPHQHEASEIYGVPSAAEWQGVLTALSAMRGDIGRLRRDYRELEQRVTAAERQHENSEVPA